MKYEMSVQVMTGLAANFPTQTLTEWWADCDRL